MNKIIHALPLLAAILILTSNMSAQTQLPGQSSPDFQISSIAMAAEHIDAMVKFYGEVFATTFTPFDAGGMNIYQGNLFGITTLIVPNAIAGVEAKQSRHQFELRVKDMEAMKKRATESGGSVREEQNEGGMHSATILDPDGNTIVFIEQK